MPEGGIGGGGYEFGEVVIPFRASVDSAIQGINKLYDSLVGLGKQVNAAGDAFLKLKTDKNGDPIKALDNSTLRVIDRMARFLTAISAVKDGLDLMYGAGNTASIAFTALGEGMRVFSNLAQLTTTTFGQIAAGVAGAAFALASFAIAWAEARIKATDAITDLTLRAEQISQRYKDTLKGMTLAQQAFNDTYGERAQANYAAARGQLESNIKTIRDLEIEIEKYNKDVRDLESKEGITGPKKTIETEKYFGGEFGEGGTWMKVTETINEGSAALQEARLKVDALNRALYNLQHENADIQRDAVFLRLAADLGKFSTAIRTAQQELRAFNYFADAAVKLAEQLQPFAEFGEDKVEAARIANAKEELKIRTDLYEQTVKELAANKELLATLQAKKGVITIEDQLKMKELRDKIYDRENFTQDELLAVIRAQEALHKELAPGAFTDRFTKPFTDAIGNAVINGIIQGQKGMEILANIGKNLFNAAMQDVMKNFQQGMITVFKSIAGAGGELLGSALITVVGVVAGILGRRASSTDTFDKIKKQIESTEAVRGIVAGPTNVAIAAVGDNLKRALVGVEQRLDVLIQVSLQIRDRAGGVPLAGSVTA